MKIITVVGARPQFIKASMVSRAFLKEGINEQIIHTGQHYDESMSDIFFSEMQIPPPFINLEVKSTLHGEMTGQMMAGIEKRILEDKPDALLVYGDTNSTLAAALAAVKLHLKLIHVEAGLRSFNMNMAEEINRILTDRISNLLCCPSDNAVMNLRREGFEHFNCTFVKTGDVMRDASDFFVKESAGKFNIIEKLKLKDFILCTFHRAENTNDPVRLKNIIDAIDEIHNQIPVVMPIHPRTQKTINALGLKPSFTIIEAQGYFSMLQLLQNCKMVITDSGGLQKEAYFFSKMCVTLRDDTEWNELVDHGVNYLTGADKSKIISSVRKALNEKRDFSIPFFGDGHAAEKIISEVKKLLN